MQGDLTDPELMKSFGKPQTGDVMATYGSSLTPQVPRYLVWPTSLPSASQDAQKNTRIKIVDFGEAFLRGPESNIHCPLIFRAPEAVFTAQQDLQADIWSLGCTVRAP